ncbi:hypothetical protein MTO96_006201 [Rhipicephalus appendiculatus]
MFMMQDKRSLARRQNPLMVHFMGTFRRYVRLIFPALAVLLAASLIPLMLEGPADNLMFYDQINVCHKTWWALPLLVNNFKRIEETLLQGCAWFASVLLSVIVIYVPTPWNQGHMPPENGHRVVRRPSPRRLVFAFLVAALRMRHWTWRMVFRAVDSRIMKELNNSTAGKKPPLPEIIENNHEKSRL